MASGEQKPNLDTAERIDQLNQIDQDVAKLLRSAGLAIKSLSDSPLENAGESVALNGSIEERRDRFASAMTQYLSLLSSIDTRLQQQIYALAEADVLPSEPESREHQADLHSSKTARSTSDPLLSKPVETKPESTSGSGLGTLDVGWLNSRNDNIRKEMEAELWAKALDLSINLRKTHENEEI